MVINADAQLRQQRATARSDVTLQQVKGFMHAQATDEQRARAATQDGNFTVVSIFVNPLQFSSEADYEGYPRTLGVDARLLTDASVDVLFAPSAAEVFPKEQSFPEIDPGVVGERFEGEFRPGHFAGMLKVVSRLLDIVVPDRAYFGEKDAQQVALVTQMVDAQVHSGRREPMSVVVCPTIRSEQGLALSSRNLRLSGAELESATELYGALVG